MVRLVLIPESHHVQHEYLQFADHIGRKKIPVDFNGDGRIFSFPGPGGQDALDHPADQAGEGGDVDDAGITVHHGGGRDTAGDADF